MNNLKIWKNFLYKLDCEDTLIEKSFSQLNWPLWSPPETLQNYQWENFLTRMNASSGAFGALWPRNFSFPRVFKDCLGRVEDRSYTYLGIASKANSRTPEFLLPAGKNKALFLDRDGVINVDHGYVHQPEKLDFMPGVFDLCRFAQDLGHKIIILTNQSGVARGYFDEAKVTAFHQLLLEHFKQKQVVISDILFCPYHPEGKGSFSLHSINRKPRAGMALQAQILHNIDMTKSLMIGDRSSDRLLGIGLKTLFLKGKYSLKEDPQEILNHLQEAKKFLVKD